MQEISKCFDLKDKGFNYNKEKSARFYFVAKNKGEIIVEGPKVDDKENLLKFGKKHQNIFTRSGKIYAREKLTLDLKEFIEDWKKKNQQKMSEMYVRKLEIIES